MTYWTVAFGCYRRRSSRFRSELREHGVHLACSPFSVVQVLLCLAIFGEVNSRHLLLGLDATLEKTFDIDMGLYSLSYYFIVYWGYFIVQFQMIEFADMLRDF